MELGGYDNSILAVLLCTHGHAGKVRALSSARRCYMNWDQVEGKWKQMKGAAKKQWGKLTEDDLDYMAGSRDQFVGRLQ
jgi:hypothetical protein